MESVQRMAPAPSSSASHRRTRLRPGEVVAGKYEVEHLVGQGASGEVWSVRETSTGARFALKVLAADAATDDENVERFRREAYFLARAQSEHVARIHDFVFDSGIGMALVMELVEGEPLAVALDQRTLSVEEAVELGVDLLAGVEVLHAARVIHRDLKPGNVILRAQPDGRPRPVICDFGLSRQARRREGDSLSAPSLTELTKGNMTLGTLRYMAPEQVLNARQATEQSDLYAVGAILFRAVTGVHVFGEHEEPRAMARAKVMGEAPRFETGRTDAMALALEQVVTRALRRRPGERHEDATEMREALARAAELGPAFHAESVTQRISMPDIFETPVRPIPVGPLPPPAAWQASRWAAATAVLLVFAAGVTAGRVWTLGGLQGTTPVAVAAPVHPPSIEAPQALPEIAELGTSAAPAPTTHATSSSAPVVPPTITVASLQRAPRPAPTEPAADDDNPY